MQRKASAVCVQYTFFMITGFPRMAGSTPSDDGRMMNGVSPWQVVLRLRLCHDHVITRGGSEEGSMAFFRRCRLLLLFWVSGFDSDKKLAGIVFVLIQ